MELSRNVVRTLPVEEHAQPETPPTVVAGAVAAGTTDLIEAMADHADVASQARQVKFTYQSCCGCGCEDSTGYAWVPLDHPIKDGDYLDTEEYARFSDAIYGMGSEITERSTPSARPTLVSTMLNDIQKKRKAVK